MTTVNEPASHSGQADLEKRVEVAVRQRQYAIGEADTASKWLLTKNVWSCSALIGVADQGGSAFLCHLDTPRSVRALDRLVSDLRQLNLDPSKFKLYAVGGISPLWTWSPLVLVLVFATFRLHNWLCSMAVVMWATFFNATRAWLYLRILLNNELVGLPTSMGFSSAWLGLGKCSVLVDAKTGVIKKRSYGPMEEKDRFSPPEAPLKADGSA